MSTYSTGVVRLVKGSSNVNGTSTNWNSGIIASNWFITFDNSKTWYQIKTINSSVNLTLSTQYNGTSQSGVSYLALDVIPKYDYDIISTGIFSSIPTTRPSLPGQLWNNNGVLSISV